MSWAGLRVAVNDAASYGDAVLIWIWQAIQMQLIDKIAANWPRKAIAAQELHILSVRVRSGETKEREAERSLANDPKVSRMRFTF